MYEIVIAALLACDVADGAAKLAFDHNQSFIEHSLPIAARNDCEIRNEIGEAVIQLPCGRVDAGVSGVYVLVVVPSTQRDLYISRPEIRPQNISGREARITKPAVAVFRLIGRRKLKRVRYARV